MAALASIGLSSSPKNGYSTPAAIGNAERVVNEREEKVLPDVRHDGAA